MTQEAETPATPSATDAVSESQTATSDEVSEPTAATPDPMRTLCQTETNRWYGITGLAFLFGGVAILTTTPGLLLASAICVGVLGLVQAVPTPEPQFRVSRTFEPANPEPGDEVTVTVRIQNVGGGTVPDIRVVDLVPDGLSVVDGSPRRGDMLVPDGTMTLSYSVLARRGTHEFAGALAVVRDIAGATETKYRIEATESLVCPPTFEPLQAVPLRSLTMGFVGRVATDTGGQGVEFHATREYRPGDPMSRIDWKRRARSGDLATLEFRTEQAASVVLVADTRPDAFLQPDRYTPSAVDRGIDAVAHLFPTLLDSGDVVGIATLSDEQAWLPPGTGTDHRERARELLATDPAFSPARDSRQVPPLVAVHALRQRLGDEDQLVLCSPLCDDGIERTVRLLEAYGHRVTVVSPDPTTRESPGGRTAHIDRQLRIARIRRLGVRVVDWEGDTDLDTALSRASRRWSA